MKISVVITTYKRPEVVKRAIKSVLKQTYIPKEIIVIEDASETGIETWIAFNYPQIKYFRNEDNLGLAGSRNKAVELAQQEWIAFLDDDDEWLPNRLAEQVKAYDKAFLIDNDKYVSIQVGTKQLNPDGTLKNLNLPENNGKLADSIKELGANTPSSSFLFKKEILRKINGFDENLTSGIDHDIWMKLAITGYSNLTVSKPLVIIYDDDFETMMTNTAKRIAGLKQYVEKWTPTYQDWFGDKEGVIYAKKYFIRVIGKLAAQKLAGACFEEGFKVVKEVANFAGWHPVLHLLAIKIMAKGYIRIKFPKLSALKKNIINKLN